MKFFDRIEFKEQAKAEITISSKFQDTLPSKVEISKSGMWSENAHFIHEGSNYNHVNEFISFELHKKLLDELAEVKHRGLFMYSGFVEPMLDKIYDLGNMQKYF